MLDGDSYPFHPAAERSHGLNFFVATVSEVKGKPDAAVGEVTLGLGNLQRLYGGASFVRHEAELPDERKKPDMLGKTIVKPKNEVQCLKPAMVVSPRLRHLGPVEVTIVAAVAKVSKEIRREREGQQGQT